MLRIKTFWQFFFNLSPREHSHISCKVILYHVYEVILIYWKKDKNMHCAALEKGVALERKKIAHVMESRLFFIWISLPERYRHRLIISRSWHTLICEKICWAGVLCPKLATWSYWPSSLWPQIWSKALFQAR